MRCLSMLLATCYLMLFSCVSYELESPPPKNAPAYPPGHSEWRYLPQIGGHYNTFLQQTANTCGNEWDVPPKNEIWNFILKDDARGRLNLEDSTPFYTFQNTELLLDKDGYFSKTATSETFKLNDNHFAYKINFRLKATNNMLAANITVNHLVAANDSAKLEPVCERKFVASGYGRYAPKVLPAQNIEGEYAALAVKQNGQCLPEKTKFPPYFFVNIIPQDDGTAHLDISGLFVENLSVEDDIKATGYTLYERFDFSGYILPDKLSLKIKMTVFNGCVEEYGISGEKRFDENRGDDATIDGIFSAWLYLETNTCETDGPIYQKFHLNLLKIDEESIRVVIGNKDYIMKRKNDTLFAAKRVIGGAVYKITDTISLDITPDKISGSLHIDNTIYKCQMLYKINGKKLYKHN